MSSSVQWVNDDGGRAAAGFRGETRDCGVRAIAIAFRMDYREVYDLVARYGERERRSRRRRRKSHPRTGIYIATFRRIAADLGASWTPTMGIGTGCRVHVRPDELPRGRLILNVSRHYCAFIDGVLHDTHDCSRGGTRCVYGFWTVPTGASPLHEIDREWQSATRELRT